MTATAIREPQPIAELTQEQPKSMTWSVFQKRYLVREDKYKYEWVRGAVVKTLRTMNFTQQFICDNLIDLFTNLRLAGKVDGRLSEETDVFFLKDAHRRPDLAYFTQAQRKLMANGINQVPQFVVEIISNTDQMNKMVDKMQDYRAAQVPVVWHIFPNYNEIHVYQGKKMTIHTGSDICSAAPVLPDFEMTVEAVLTKP
jgi:Uma2 family endonuclease